MSKGKSFGTGSSKRGGQTSSPTRTFTIRDVAKRAAVSVATVSRVLNTPERVRERTRKRVHKVMQSLSYVPNQMASALARNRSGCIGLIVPNLHSFFAPLVEAAEKTVRAAGRSLLITTNQTQGDGAETAIQLFKRRQCDAIILHPGNASDRRVLDLLKAEPNLIVLQRCLAPHQNRCVMVDHRAGARVAARHLIDNGHSEIGVITGPENNVESNERLEAFIDAMSDAGLSVDPALVAKGDFRLASGEVAMANLLASGRSISAVFCFSDDMASGAVSCLRANGRSVPDDISVIGFDDFVFASNICPRLTTVRLPVAEIGRVAAVRALALSDRARVPTESAVLSPSLIMRDSVRSRRPAVNITRPLPESIYPMTIV